MEIATLAVQVDSRSVKSAESDLRGLTSAGQQAERSMGGVSNSSNQASQALERQSGAARQLTAVVRQYAQIAVGAFSVQQIVRSADAWQQMQNRLRLVTSSSQELARATDEVFKISQRASASMDATAQVFQRFAQNSTQLGISLDKVSELTETVSKAVAISGATAGAAEAALMQFGQALAAGSLRGEELNSVLEQTPGLAQAIAVGMGVAVGSLKELAQEGRITGEVMVEALTNARNFVDDQFSTRIKTLSDHFVELGNASTRLIGELNESTGATQALGRGIEFLTENLSTVASIIGTIVAARLAPWIVSVGAAAATAASQLAAAGTALTVLSRGAMALVGGPLGAIVTAIGLGATAWQVFGRDAENALEAASRGVLETNSGLDAMLEKFKELNIVQQRMAIAEKQDALSQATKAASEALDELIGKVALAEGTRGAPRIRAAFSEALQGIVEDTEASSGEVAQSIMDLVDKMVSGSKLGEPYRQQLLAQIQAYIDLRSRISQYSAELSGMQAILEDVRRSLTGTNDALSDQQRALGEFMKTYATSSERMAAELEKWDKALGGLTDEQRQRIIDRFTPKVRQLAEKLTEAEKAQQDFERSRRQYLNGLYGEISALQDQARSLDEQIALYGLAESAKYDLAIADLEAQKAALAVIDAGAEEIAILERKIELLQQMKGSQQTLERLDAEKQAWETWSRDVEQIFGRVGQSLTDKIVDSGFKARDLLKDIFKAVTFNILINPIMNQMQGWVTNQLGGLFGVQNPQQGGGMLGTAQNLYSGYNAITGGLNSTLGNAAQWLGQKIGSEALTSFGLGLSGTTAATGIASIGASLGASLGTSIGTSAAAMTTTTFSAALGGGAAAGGAAAGGAAAAAGGAAAGGAAAGGAAGIGAAVGSALPWIGGALAIGSAFGLFDDRLPTTRRSQQGHAELLGDGKVYVSTWDDRQSRESQEAAAKIAEDSINAALGLFDKIGIDAAFTRFTTLMESSILGDKQGVGSSATVRIGDLEHEIGLAIESSWTKHGVGGWSDAEMLPRLATDIQLTLLEAFQVAGDALPSMLSSMLADVDIRSLSAEQAQALAQAFQVAVEQINAMQSALQALPFITLRDVSFEVTANLIEFAGGMEALGAGVSAYYEHFYSQEEQLAWASEQMAAKFGELGLAMPDLTQGAEMARVEFRRLVESMDPMTEEGQRAIATLMTMAGGFNELVTGLDEVAAATKRAAEEQRKAAEQAHQLVLGDLSAAYNDLVRAGQAEIARLQETFGRTDTLMEAYRSSFQRLESEINSLFTSIDRGIQALRGTGSALNADYYKARAVISTALVTGQLPQTADLTQAISIAQQGVMGQRYASAFDQREAYQKLAAELEGLQAIAEPELDAAQATLKELERQYRLLRGMSEVDESSLRVLERQLRAALSAEQSARWQIAAIEEQINWAEEQYNVLLEIRDGLLEFPEALNAFTQALAEALKSQGAGGSSGTNAGLPWEQYPVPVGPGSDYERAVAYYNANPDVAAAFNKTSGVSFVDFAKEHYETFGKSEGRRAFALGGFATPGWALVGEEGPELVNFSAPGRVYTANQTNDILRSMGAAQGGNLQREIVSEMRQLRAEVSGLRAEQKSSQFAIAKYTQKVARLQEKWDAIGMPQEQVEVSA